MLVDRARQDHQVGLLSADRGPGIVDRRDQGGGETGLFQGRVQGHRGFEVGEGQDYRGHGRFSARSGRR